jgi:hypothetical protein
VQSASVVDTLNSYDFSDTHTFCDVAGGHGHLMCTFLQAYPHMQGIVFDLPEVVGDLDALWAPRLGLQDQCRYVGGDMFKSVPSADAYSLKLILHDWEDTACIQILSNLRKAASPGARLLIIEHVVPDHATSHFAKLFDIHMMCWGTGRERTEAEYHHLMEQAGWIPTGTHYPPSRTIGVITGVCGD